MTLNLIKESWTNVDSFELRLLLDNRIGGPGQYDGSSNLPNKLHLPLADSSCRISLIFRDKKIAAIEPGPAFDLREWEEISEEIEKSIICSTLKIGRDYSFSTFRVEGYWRGERSGIQILPPPDDEPRADVEIADHPFILEFPIQASPCWPITNHRRIREHRKLTLLLNILLRGHTSLQPRRSQHFWAMVRGGHPEFQWVQQFFFAKLGEAVIDHFSASSGQQIETVEPHEYYANVGHDGRSLRVPADLDESLCLYFKLSPPNRDKLDRATFWVDMASRQWNISVSSSFASLVSAIESLTERGTTHRVYCDVCKGQFQHDAPGATETFRGFFEKFAPGAAHRKRRSQMYSLRSGILHGNELMQLDRDLAFGWDPPYWNESELHRELWGLTRIAIRNWLRNPPPINTREHIPAKREIIRPALFFSGALTGYLLGRLLKK